MIRLLAVAALTLSRAINAQDTSPPFLMNSMEASPPTELRSQFPDRLWLYDHQDEPMQGDTWWALSNDNGTSPAYWVPIKPFELANATSVDDALEVDDKLSKRLPTYIQVFMTNNCKPTAGLFKKCRTPLGGSCCSLPATGTIPGKSVFVPSFSDGDIIIPYRTRGCAGVAPAPMTYGFVGCYTGRGTVNSVKTASCFSCHL